MSPSLRQYYFSSLLIGYLALIVTSLAGVGMVAFWVYLQGQFPSVNSMLSWIGFLLAWYLSVPLLMTAAVSMYRHVRKVHFSFGRALPAAYLVGLPAGVFFLLEYWNVALPHVVYALMPYTVAMLFLSPLLMLYFGTRGNPLYLLLHQGVPPPLEDENSDVAKGAPEM